MNFAKLEKIHSGKRAKGADRAASITIVIVPGEISPIFARASGAGCANSSEQEKARRAFAGRAKFEKEEGLQNIH
jgi:hypothetical protein